MQAISLLFGPLVMSGADMLFQTFKNDKYLEETKRHNERMAKIEEDRVKWDQKYATEERKYARWKERKREASEGVREDRATLHRLMSKRSRTKDMMRGEMEKHKSKNPYYLATDIAVTAVVGYGMYRTIRYMSGGKDDDDESKK